MAIATIGALIGIAIAYFKYIKQSRVPVADENMLGFEKILYNKYYVDQAYHTVFVKPINWLSKIFRDRVETAISFVVTGSSVIVDTIGLQGKKLQNGNIGLYLFIFVLGFSAILTYIFLVQ